ncbi:MAG: hypothetical protein ACFE7R_06140, partial [Candidatus Hodarchaeota archaeon]
MTISDLLVLLRQDLRQTFRVSGAKGKRTEQKSFLRRMLMPIGAIAVGVVIIWAIISIIPLIGWAEFVQIAHESYEFVAVLFNAVLIFSFAGSIMISANTVGNTARMEYLLTLPIAMRTIFLEKTIIVILYSSMIWMIIGTPIFIGLSIVSSVSFAFLSVPVFIVLILALVTLGVSFGGLLGLLISRLLAGRRTLKQIGWFFGSSFAIIISVFYYYALYASNGSQLFEALIVIADLFGLSSIVSPGYAVGAVSLGILIGNPAGSLEILISILILVVGIELVFVNSYVSEVAHYSGWLASGSKRSSKTEVLIHHEGWNPQPIKGFTLNLTASTSAWYNITSIRREGRVLAQYLVGPIRFVIWIILPIA